MENIDELFSKAEQELKRTSVTGELVIPKVQVDNQKYVLLYYIKDNLGNEIMKVWGAFPDTESANLQMDIVKGKIGNEAFDMFVVEMYGLAVRPPNKDEITNQKYYNDELQALINKFDEQKSKVKKTFDTRLDLIDADHNVDKLEQEQRLDELKNLLGNVIKPDELRESVEVPREHVEAPAKPIEVPREHVVKSVEVPRASVPFDENLRNKELVEQYAIKPDKPPTHFDPEQQLNKWEQLECFQKAKQFISTNFNGQLELVKEDVRMPRQNWTLVSFTGSECKQKTELPGIIFWGVFENVNKELIDFAEKLKDSKMDIHVMELYTWVSVPPNEKYMSSVEAHETHLIDVLKRWKLKIRHDKEIFDFRKNKLITNPDMNQYQRKKDVFKQMLTEFFGDKNYIEKAPNYNKELYDKIFPKTKKMPTLELVQIAEDGTEIPIKDELLIKEARDELELKRKRDQEREA